ncbi:MAG: hypothetical protein QOF58_3968 [Pseudonocardiales bacterium]|jgi:hypothetical protein|nr:hypothetical protein [Pseudonocardiales bacterium]
MWRVLGALAAVLLCAACGQVELKTADGMPTVVPTTAPESTSATPTGPCQVEEHVPDPVTPAPPGSSPPSSGVKPDVAPHNAENNGWKQRKPLNARGVQTGRDTIARIRPLLEQVCASGDFSVDGTKKALAGYDVYVVRDYPDQAFVGYSITVSNGPAERVTCVLGDLKPGEVRMFLDGTTGEGSCYEPKSH